MRFVPPLSRTAHKNPARQRRRQDSVLPKPGAGSLSVASSEIYFIDYVLAREVAAQVFETYAEALAYAKEAGETAAREKALEQGAIEISDVIFQEEQQNAMAYGMDLFLGSEIHVEVIGKMDFTS